MKVKKFFESLKIKNLDLSNDVIELRAHRIFNDYYNDEKISNYVYGIYLKKEARLIGFCDLRLGDQNALAYLGNIGYSIFQLYRGHNYAYMASTLLLELASYLEVDSLIITVNPDNIPSIKTIEKLGAQYIKRVPVPSHEPLFQQGDYEKLIYRIAIEPKGDSYGEL